MNELEVRRELARRELIRRRVFRDKDLPFLVSLMSGKDEGDGSPFSLAHVAEPLSPGEVEVAPDGTVRANDRSWRWQRLVVDTLLSERRVMFLKGRQIGVTWVVLAVDVAEALVFQGTTSLLFRQREEDAIDNAVRWWTLYHSLPKWLTADIEVIRPSSAPLPGRDGIRLKFPSGDISSVVPMTSAVGSGHGRTVRHVMLDEAAHIENLAGIGAAVGPATGKKGRISIVSTANGRSNPETEEGNEFHRRWIDLANGYSRLFLPYHVHPDRDEEWYATDPNVLELKTWQRQEQYPRNWHEAFKFSGHTAFDKESLEFYMEHIEQPLYRCDFVEPDNRAKLARGPQALKLVYVSGDKPVPSTPSGMIRVYREPVGWHRYATFADPATGVGADNSAAYVVDLATMELVVEFHGKLSEDLFAAQLHYLGRLYGRDVPSDPRDPDTQPGFAKLAVETQGGHGAAVVAALTDRTAGRPKYGNLYRHILDNRGDKPEAKPYGYPMNRATRPKAINQLEAAYRERSLPYVTDILLSESGDFVEHSSGTTPRARDGTHDDAVIAACGVLDLYRMYGSHPGKPKRRARRGNTVGLGRERREKTFVVDEGRYKQAARST